MSYPPTDEQQKIIDAFTTGGDLVIQAGAGAGKTSTLRFLANAAPGKRGLYIAYNRAIKNDAERAFPRSVTCVTSHGLAYRAVGARYRHRLNGSRQFAREVAAIIGIDAPVRVGTTTLTQAQQARLVTGAIKRFCYSADQELNVRHVPRVLGLTREEQHALSEHLLPYMETAWRDIVDVEGRLKFEHDHYLKIWALTRPKLAYDYVLVDEAQDCNPLLTGLVLDQTHTQRIAVGDSAQQIYSWRGAEDALTQLPGQQFTLSQSFRFGPAVADQANRWLTLLDAPLRLTGYDQIPSRIGRTARPDAVLCRTNAGAMSVAMEHMAAGRRAALVGDTARQIEGFARAAIDLMAGGRAALPDLVAFTSWDQVRDYAEQEDDGADLRPLVRLVEEYDPYTLLGAVKRLHDERRAHVVISTAHKSKGREWGSVKIAADFPEPTPNRHTGQTLVRAEEARLAYVAVTRARTLLDCSALDWVSRVDGIAA